MRFVLTRVEGKAVAKQRVSLHSQIRKSSSRCLRQCYIIVPVFQRLLYLLLLIYLRRLVTFILFIPCFSARNVMPSVAIAVLQSRSAHTIVRTVSSRYQARVSAQKRTGDKVFFFYLLYLILEDVPEIASCVRIARILFRLCLQIHQILVTVDYQYQSHH